MELASASGMSLASSAPTPSVPSTPYADQPISPSTQGDHTDGDTSFGLDASPLVLPGTREHAADMEVPEMMLDRAASEMSRGQSGQSRQSEQSEPSEPGKSKTM